MNHYAITPDLPGGTRHYDLAAELSRRGFRTKVFASDVNLALRKRTKLAPGELYRVETYDRAEFVWIKATEYERNDWRRGVNMLTFARNVAKVGTLVGHSPYPEVIIGSSPHPFAALAALRLARKLGSRFFLELRDLWPQALVDMGGFRETHPAVRFMRQLERYLYAHSDRFIVLARGSLEYLERLGIPNERVVFLPNGVHLEHFQRRLPRDATRAQYGFDRFTVVYTGAHGPANALETILRAADFLRNDPVDFVLVGDGPSKDRLRRQAAQQRLGNVRFLDPVPKSEVPDLLDAADVAVITLKNAKAFAYGISPNKLFDYMAAARPVICCVPGEMAQLVRDAGGGLVCPPEDPAALARAVRRLRQMTPEELHAMGQNGRQHVEQRYRREVLVGHLIEAIDQQPSQDVVKGVS